MMGMIEDMKGKYVWKCMDLGGCEYVWDLYVDAYPDAAVTGAIALALFDGALGRARTVFWLLNETIWVFIFTTVLYLYQ